MAPLPEPLRHSFALRIDLTEVGRARDLITEVATEAGFSEERRFDIQVASSEACANAIEHSPSGAEVTLEVLTHHDRLEVRVEGPGQFELPAIAARDGLSRGLGLPLMAKLSDHLALYSGPRGGTLVALTFYRPGFHDENPDDVTPPSTVELLKENELVTAILGSITDEVWFADAQKRFTLANAAAFAEFGTASLEGTTVEDLAASAEVYHADMTPRPVEEAPPLLALAGEVVRNQEEVVRTPATGELRYRLVNAAPVRDAAGEVFGAVSVVRDVTERKEAEQRYRRLFNTLIEGFCVVEVVFDEDDNPVDYRFLETNPTFEEQTGLHDVEGKLIREIAPDNDAYWYQIYGKVALTGEPARFQAPSTPLGRIYDVSAFRVGGPSSRQVGILFNDISEQKWAEEALRRSEGRLAEAQHIGRIGSWEWNIQTGEVSWSAELYSLYQVDPDTFVPSIQAFGEYIHLDDRGRVDEIIGQILSGRTPGDFDFRIVLADGSIRCLNTTCQITECDKAGRPRFMVGVNQDITERKRAEQILHRLNRTLAAHSASDQALIRATDESGYLADVCRIVVEDCGHAMVWIGYKEDDDDRSVRPVASAGFGEDYLDTLNVTWADSERGRGPTGTAVRTGRPSKCRNMLTDPAFAPWRVDALRRGYASSIALPLLQDGTAFGAITIYSSEPDPFSDDEAKLLADLSNDLALGITTLRLRAAHAEAERERDILLAEEQQLTEELQAKNEELHAQTEELQSQTEELAARERQLKEQNEELLAGRYNRTLIEASLDPLVTIGLDGTITDVNEAAVKITGYSREEIIGTDFSDYFTDPEKARLGYQEAFAVGSVTDYPLTICSRDEMRTDVLYNATVYRDQAGKVQGVFAAARDITAIKELELQREIASTLQEALLDIPEETSLLRFSHLYRSATREASVGGDFYDVFKVKDNRIAVLIGDVSGHGVEAARVAILVKDVVHAFAHELSQPEIVLSKTNDLLLEKRIPGFVTVFLGILDPDTGVLKYSSAGHPPALLRTAEGGVGELASGSAPVGVLPGHSWKDAQVQLYEGDLLLLYTDGLIEARRNGSFFGQEGLVKSLTHWNDPSPELLPKALLGEVLSFSGGALSDDVAMLALCLRTAPDDGSKRALPQERPLR